MALLVRAFPLVRPVAELEAFAAEVAARKEETDAFYRRLHVTHESWHLQDTPAGPWVIAVARLDNPGDSAAILVESAVDYDNWFKSKVAHLSGIDPNQKPLGPPTTQVFAWSDDDHPSNNLCA